MKLDFSISSLLLLRGNSAMLPGKAESDSTTDVGRLFGVVHRVLTDHELKALAGEFFVDPSDVRDVKSIVRLLDVAQSDDAKKH